MSLYRIMLADDEEEIRDGIRRKIDWEGIGFELVGSAENGQEALEMAEALHPDVVMTDIKMPFMDGLTLGKRLAEIMPTAKLVIFSGFDDFEYAQKAIQINVAEYILKPIDATELTSVLRRIKTQLDGEFAEKRNVELLRERYQNSLPVLREQFYTRLLDGRISPSRIEEQSALYGIELPGKFLSVALTHLDADDDAPIRQRELLPLSLRQLIDENLGRRCDFISTLYNDSVAVIAGFENAEQVLELIDGMNQICKQARRFLGLTLTVGIGSPCESPSELRLAASGARSALDYRVLIGAGRAIYIEDVEPDPTAHIPFDERDKHDLNAAIKLGTPEHISAAAERLIGRLRESRLPIGQYQLYFMEVLAELVKLTRTYQLDMAEVFGRDFDGNFHLTGFDSLDALSVWFTDICLKISSLIRRERTNSSKETAENAKHFIAENYADFDISVEMLCAHLHVSPAYFSTLFKKETGMSFVAYLTQIRMDKAVELLSTTEDKTYEISLKVGYSEPNYFSYVFKKQFGMSPTKYRSSKGENNA